MRSTPSPVRAETGTSAAKSPSARDPLDRGADRGRAESRSTLLTAITTGVPRREHALGDEPVAGAGRLGAVEHEQDRVDVGQRLVDRALHPAGEAVARRLEARQVEQHELPVVAVHDARDAAARGLRLVGHDRHVRAAERVHERRLADVRTPGDPDEGRAERLAHRRKRSGRISSSVNVVSSPSRGNVIVQSALGELRDHLPAGAARRHARGRPGHHDRGDARVALRRRRARSPSARRRWSCRRSRSRRCRRSPRCRPSNTTAAPTVNPEYGA